MDNMRLDEIKYTIYDNDLLICTFKDTKLGEEKAGVIIASLESSGYFDKLEPHVDRKMYFIYEHDAFPGTANLVGHGDFEYDMKVTLWYGEPYGNTYLQMAYPKFIDGQIEFMLTDPLLNQDRGGAEMFKLIYEGILEEELQQE